MAIRDRLVKALRLPAGATTQTEQQIAAQSPQSGMTATPLEREPQLANVPFPPAMPLIPSLINRPREDGRADPRKYEFPVAWNIQIVEQRNIPFRLLREVADGADIVRKCIEVNKSIIAGMNWDIVIGEDAITRTMAENSVGSTEAARLVREQLAAEITRAKDFWRSPDRMNGMSFQEWVSMALEEVLVIDALSIYPNRTLDDKTMHSLEILDGSTIKPLLNAHGSRPLPPHPAFQQILWGFPRGEFTAAPDADGEFTADDLVYAPRNRRSFTPYGLSPVERCLTLVDLYMKRLHWFKTEFTDGAIPDLAVMTDMEFGQNPQLLRAYEQIFNDDLAGNLEARRGARLFPKGFQPEVLAQSDAKYSDTFDNFLIKSICGHFGVLPSQIGFTPDNGLGGKGHQDGEAATADMVGVRPLLEWFEDLLNQLSYKFLNMPRDLKFTFTNEETEDDSLRATTRQMEFFSAQKTLNEIRSEMGQPLFTFPEADAPLIIQGGSVMPLAAAFENVAINADEQDTGIVDDKPDLEPVKTELATFLKWAKVEKRRDFEFSHLDEYEAVVLNALIKTDAEAARHYADVLLKAGGVRPKVRRGEPFPKNHPARTKAIQLTAKYKKKVLSSGIVDAEAIAKAWLDNPSADPVQFLNERKVRVYGGELEQVLTDLYSEAGWMGVASARVLVARARRIQKADSGLKVDWEGWTPGNPLAAEKLLDKNGFGSALRGTYSSVKGTVKSINDTRMKIIGRELAKGLEAGLSVDALARNIRGQMENPALAEMVAHTEMTYAVTAAQKDVYKENNTTMVEWQIADDNACDDCKEMADNSPYPIDAVPEEPPFHPFCGCQLIPADFADEAGDLFGEIEQELVTGEPVEELEPEVETHPESDVEPELVAEADVVQPEAEPAELLPAKYDASEIENRITELFEQVAKDANGNWIHDWDGYTGKGDKMLERLWREQGFDAKPTLVSDTQYETLKAEGWQPVYRGIAAETPELVQQYVDAYKTGEPFAGKGLFGNGTYVSVAEETANHFMSHTAAGAEIPFGQRMDMLINPKANIVDIETIYNERRNTLDNYYRQTEQIESRYGFDPMGRSQREWENNLPKDVRERYQNLNTAKEIFEDPSRFATAQGYDGIKIVNPVVSFGGEAINDTYIVILNRSAVAIRK